MILNNINAAKRLISMGKRLREPAHIKLYLRDVCVMHNLSKALQDTLLLVVKKLDYEGVITFSNRFRADVSKKLGITPERLRKRLAELTKSGVIFRRSTEYRNEYVVNPHIIARGSWEDINRFRSKFKIIISYDSKKRKTIKYEYNFEEDGCEDVVNETCYNQSDADVNSHATESTPPVVSESNIVTAKDATKILIEEVELFCLNSGTLQFDVILRGLLLNTWLDAFFEGKDASRINIATCKRYIFKCFFNHLTKEKKMTPLQYKSTIESLTDYSWADGIEIGDDLTDADRCYSN